MKYGAFRLAIEGQMPIIPIVISTYGDVCNMKTMVFKGGKVQVKGSYSMVVSVRSNEFYKVLPPISTEGKSETDIVPLMRHMRFLHCQSLRDTVVAKKLSKERMKFFVHVDIIKSDTSQVIFCDLPGVAKVNQRLHSAFVGNVKTQADLVLSAKNNVLTISGDRTVKLPRGFSYALSNRAFGGFSQLIKLPKGADIHQISATLESGVLEVIVPTGVALDAEYGATRIPVSTKAEVNGSPGEPSIPVQKPRISIRIRVRNLFVSLWALIAGET
ncbi:hypothetical protein HDU82_006693 [Entophlyctis luteolus]|nr:hypothetical protein HDU82_006693 [Entophlyctis luteolus]